MELAEDGAHFLRIGYRRIEGEKIRLQFGDALLDGHDHFTLFVVVLEGGGLLDQGLLLLGVAEKQRGLGLRLFAVGFDNAGGAVQALQDADDVLNRLYSRFRVGYDTF